MFTLCNNYSAPSLHSVLAKNGVLKVGVTSVAAGERICSLLPTVSSRFSSWKSALGDGMGGCVAQ